MRKVRGLKTRTNERTDSTQSNTVFLHEFLEGPFLDPTRRRQTSHRRSSKISGTGMPEQKRSALDHPNNHISTKLLDKPVQRVSMRSTRKGFVRVVVDNKRTPTSEQHASKTCLGLKNMHGTHDVLGIFARVGRDAMHHPTMRLRYLTPDCQMDRTEQIRKAHDS